MMKRPLRIITRSLTLSRRLQFFFGHKTVAVGISWENELSNELGDLLFLELAVFVGVKTF